MNQKRNERLSAPRQRRATIAKETVEIVGQGAYQSPSGALVSIRDQIKAAVDSTVLYNRKCNFPPTPTKARFQSPCTIEIVDERTADAAQRLISESSHQNDDQQHHVGCLNFASARNPGGGFLKGAQAQEESLTRASALYPCLLTQSSGFYEAHCRNNNNFLYQDLAIVSPQVPFFRDDGDQLLLQPFLCTVITSPAPNAGEFQKRNLSKNANADIQTTLLHRSEMILHCAALHKVDTLVLGAWGCGVFRNDPEQIARAFQYWLSPGRKYEHQFCRVIFAIPKSNKDQNFMVFTNVFRT